MVLGSETASSQSYLFLYSAGMNAAKIHVTIKLSSFEKVPYLSVLIPLYSGATHRVLCTVGMS